MSTQRPNARTEATRRLKVYSSIKIEIRKFYLFIFIIILGETLVVSQGGIGSDQYRNIRIFRMIERSITVIYIYLATLFDSKPIDELQYLRDNNFEKSIDIIFLSSYCTDINQ